MKKLVKLILLSSALTVAQTASAQHTYVAPAATTPWHFNGSVDVFKGIPLTCTVDLYLYGPENAGDGNAFSHSDVANINADIVLSGGPGGACASVIPDPVPVGSVSYVGGNLIFDEVFVQTITLGDCQGDIVGVWDGVNKTLAVSGSLPAATAGAPCTMDGILDLLDPSSGTIN